MATVGLNFGDTPAALSGPGGLRVKHDLRRIKSKTTAVITSRGASPGAGSVTPSGGEDPLRKLAPAQKKLATVEAQRVLGTMDEATRRMENALVLPFLASSLDRFSVSLGAELAALMHEFQRLSDEYKRLHEALEAEGTTFPDRSGDRIDSCSTLGSEGGSTTQLNKPGQLEPLPHQSESSLEDQFHHLQFQLKHCVKNILREMSRNPSTSSILQVAAKEKSHGATKLIESVGVLREVVHERLLMTRVEEVQREELLREVAERQRGAEERLERLEAELTEAQQRMSEEVSPRSSETGSLHWSAVLYLNLVFRTSSPYICVYTISKLIMIVVG